jgi:small subunit ribosomal protein S21
VPTVIIKDDEPFEFALRKFKKLVERAGILTELRRREHYEKPSEVKKRKLLAARKRMLRKLRREQGKERWE